MRSFGRAYSKSVLRRSSGMTSFSLAMRRSYCSAADRSSGVFLMAWKRRGRVQSNCSAPSSQSKKLPSSLMKVLRRAWSHPFLEIAAKRQGPSPEHTIDLVAPAIRQFGEVECQVVSSAESFVGEVTPDRIKLVEPSASPGLEVSVGLSERSLDE